jgi:hypothetical protein
MFSFFLKNGKPRDVNAEMALCMMATNTMTMTTEMGTTPREMRMKMMTTETTPTPSVPWSVRQRQRRRYAQCISRRLVSILYINAVLFCRVALFFVSDVTLSTFQKFCFLFADCTFRGCNKEFGNRADLWAHKKEQNHSYKRARAASGSGAQEAKQKSEKKLKTGYVMLFLVQQKQNSWV